MALDFVASHSTVYNLQNPQIKRFLVFYLPY